MSTHTHTHTHTPTTAVAKSTAAVTLVVSSRTEEPAPPAKKPTVNKCPALPLPTARNALEIDAPKQVKAVDPPKQTTKGVVPPSMTVKKVEVSTVPKAQVSVAPTGPKDLKVDAPRQAGKVAALPNPSKVEAPTKPAKKVNCEAPLVPKAEVSVAPNAGTKDPKVDAPRQATNNKVVAAPTPANTGAKVEAPPKSAKKVNGEKVEVPTAPKAQVSVAPTGPKDPKVDAPQQVAAASKPSNTCTKVEASVKPAKKVDGEALTVPKAEVSNGPSGTKVNPTKEGAKVDTPPVSDGKVPSKPVKESRPQTAIKSHLACVICLDDRFEDSQGLSCGRKTRHFVCWTCLSAFAIEQASLKPENLSRLSAREGVLSCPGTNQLRGN
jgi:hypothetical protein